MPDLNPGIVVASPFLSDDFQLTRCAQYINAVGRVVQDYGPPIEAFGIVTQASQRDLERLPEFQQAEAVISVVTENELRGPTPGAQPDIITWAGTSYLVRAVLPYPRFGQGWYKALAVSQNAIDLQPEPIDGE